jgi:glycosyltransferase involved in cell wall biosynthesis
VLIAACRQLTERGITYALHIYGSARPEDEQYEERCRKAAEGLPVTFHGSIENGKLPPIYASSDIFVNLTPAGNYDKTVLEAMSCGTVVVASSEAFADIIAGEHRPTEADATALAQVLEQLIKMAHPRKADLREQYRKYVHDQHSLDRWAHEVTQNLDMLL